MTRVQLLHFAPKHTKDAEGKTVTTWDDTSKLWAIISDSDEFYSGYIPNIFGIKEFKKDKTDGNISVQYEVKLKHKVIMEKSNGGRSNHKEYKTIEEYIADPRVKAKYQRNIQLDMVGKIFGGEVGDPQDVDIIATFVYDRMQKYDNVVSGRSIPVEFKLEATEYDVLPNEWYSEVFQDKIDLSGGVFETAEEAIKHITQESPVDDLFGQRYFPVAIFPNTVDVDVATDICSYFKSHSKPILKNNQIIIGIRSKVYEIEHINNVYQKNGKISKNLTWDW